MNSYEQYTQEYNKRWQERIINTCFICAVVIVLFEIAYFFIITATGLRDQTPLVYWLRFILLPGSIILTASLLGRHLVKHSRMKRERKSFIALLTTVVICCTAASVHNIFSAAMCSFFIPISLSVVFGKKMITHMIGCCCIVAEVIAMAFAWTDVRGDSPYFFLDCLMFFIVFAMCWYAALLLMTNEQEKRSVIDHLRHEQTLLEQKICRDGLTGLYNLLGVQLYSEGKAVEHNPDLRHSSIAFFDVDNFKSVNDSFGHEAGNRILIYFARVFREHFPEESCIARYGGDEFVVLLPGVAPQQAKEMIDKLLHFIATEGFPGIPSYQVSLSCGISAYDFYDPVLEAITTSDRAMYSAKTMGKNRSVVSSE